MDISPIALGSGVVSVLSSWVVLVVRNEVRMSQEASEKASSERIEEIHKDVANTRLDVANMRIEIANARAVGSEAAANDRSETMRWINGAFMRAPVVEAKMQDMERRLAVQESLTRDALVSLAKRDRERDD